jgi:hypothetical protein
MRGQLHSLLDLFLASFMVLIQSDIRSGIQAKTDSIIAFSSATFND